MLELRQLRLRFVLCENTRQERRQQVIQCVVIGDVAQSIRHGPGDTLHLQLKAKEPKQLLSITPILGRGDTASGSLKCIRQFVTPKLPVHVRIRIGHGVARETKARTRHLLPLMKSPLISGIGYNRRINSAQWVNRGMVCRPVLAKLRGESPNSRD